MLASRLKTFILWSSLGAGLFLSGFFCVETVLELRGDPQSEHFLALVVVFAFAGGIFVGLLALAVRQLAEFPSLLGETLPQGQALLERAARLGLSLQHTRNDKGNLLEPDLQRRVLEVEKALRERRALSIAVVAAVVSSLGALAAWYTHLK